MLNKQGPGKIDWTDYTWNPISGCQHGCDYCYMLRMEKRFPGIMAPVMHHGRLEDCGKLKKPSKIFVGSSGDMWGKWVHRRWIHSVFRFVRKYNQHTYQFLTKNPERYWDFDFREFNNCWFGTTVDGTKRTENNISALVCAIDQQGIKFVSFEPLLKYVSVPGDEWQELDWIIIGANSNRGAEKPPMVWAKNLIQEARRRGVPVWVKDNYGYPETIKEFPKTKGANHGCQKTENQK